MNFIFKLKIIILIMIFSGNLNSQTTNSEFDSLIILQPDKMINQNVSRQEIIKWNMKMLEKAKKNNYQKGIIWAKANICAQYHNLAKPDLSLKYINEAKILADDISADNETYAKIYFEFSRTYYTLGLFDLSLKYNSKGMYYSKKIEDSKYKKNFLGKIYNVRALNLIQTESDSVLYYLHRYAKTSQSIRSYADLGNYYINIHQDLDSAKVYLNKAETIYFKDKQIDNYTLSVLYYYFGCLYSKENKNAEAITYLEKSLLYASSGKNRQHLLGLYNLLAVTYRKIGDTDKEKDILEEYKKFNESYKDAQARSVQITIENLEKELSKKENNSTDNIFVYSLFLVLSGSVVLFLYFKKRKKLSIPEERIIVEQYSEFVEQEIKPTITLDDLYESAKTRDPNFYTKFQNLYPDFFKNILEINSEIQKNELHLLTYIYLNFETKEIADILFLSPKTIQNKKHKIRKKLNIQSSEDLYIWLKSF